MTITPVQAHTPGPWTIERRNSSGEHELDNYFVIVAADGTVVAESEFYNVESPEANARLMAASPELLLELKAGLSLLQSIENEVGYCTAETQRQWALLIAKVEAL